MPAPTNEIPNIDRFNLMVGQIMERLIEACPQPVEFSAESLGLQAGEYSGLHYLRSSDEQFLASALQWLVDEGFIRGKSEHVITLKGLELYNRVPNRLKK